MLFVGASESYDTDAWDAAVFKKQNATLRELVLEWRELAVGGAESLTDRNRIQADLDQRMREMGVRWEPMPKWASHPKEHDKAHECDEEIKRIKIENAKLRSICAEVAGILFNLDVDHCGLCDRDDINHPCPVHTVKGGECLIESELRELGVEVNDG